MRKRLVDLTDLIKMAHIHTHLLMFVENTSAVFCLVSTKTNIVCCCLSFKIRIIERKKFCVVGGWQTEMFDCICCCCFVDRLMIARVLIDDIGLNCEQLPLVV